MKLGGKVKPSTLDTYVAMNRSVSLLRCATYRSQRLCRKETANRAPGIGIRHFSASESQESESSSLDAVRATVPKGRDGRWLHVSPSGDSFIGDTMFAAKHLSSDYLRSIKLYSSGINKDFEEDVEEWCSGASLADLQKMYDTGELPSSFPLSRI